MSDKWISVEDRLPDETDYYIVAWRLFKHKLSVRTAYFIAGDGWEWKAGEVITHWMPLPEPPSDEKKGVDWDNVPEVMSPDEIPLFYKNACEDV